MKKLAKRVLNFFSNKKSKLNSQDFWIPVSESEQNNQNIKKVYVGEMSKEEALEHIKKVVTAI